PFLVSLKTLMAVAVYGLCFDGMRPGLASARRTNYPPTPNNQTGFTDIGILFQQFSPRAHSQISLITSMAQTDSIEPIISDVAQTENATPERPLILALGDEASLDGNLVVPVYGPGDTIKGRVTF